jgi:hypothetical protein
MSAEEKMDAGHTALAMGEQRALGFYHWFKANASLTARGTSASPYLSLMLQFDHVSGNYTAFYRPSTSAPYTLVASITTAAQITNTIPNPRLGGQTLPVHPEVRLQEYGDAPDRHRGLEAAYSFQSL